MLQLFVNQIFSAFQLVLYDNSLRLGFSLSFYYGVSREKYIETNYLVQAKELEKALQLLA